MPRKTDSYGFLRRLSLGLLFVAIVFQLSISTYSQDSRDAQKQERKRQTKPELEAKIPKTPEPEERSGYTIGVSVDLVLMYTSVF